MGLKNKFNLHELSGAFGDIATFLPLAFALAMFNDFPLTRLFLLWGTVYFFTGFYFKIPVSVQPLKAMAVIAIAGAYSLEFISSTAIFYGLLLLVLYCTGMIDLLNKIFSQALVRGIQFGVGLILASKAFEMILSKSFLLGLEGENPFLNGIIAILVLALIIIFQFYKKLPVSFFIIVFSILVVSFMSLGSFEPIESSELFVFSFPKLRYFVDALILLIIPQLPLTLGNAVFAADSSSKDLFKEQARKVSPKKLTLSIAISNIFIGLMGGFPVCHGAGGIVAHNKFGAKTGGATMIMGLILITFSIFSPLLDLLLRIPLAVLGAMLLLAAFGMLNFIRKLETKTELLIALMVGLISFTTRNLSISLLAGIALERSMAMRNFKIT